MRFEPIAIWHFENEDKYCYIEKIITNKRLRKIKIYTFPENESIEYTFEAKEEFNSLIKILEQKLRTNCFFRDKDGSLSIYEG